MKIREAQTSNTGNRRKLLLLILLPTLSVLLFGTISALSFVEISHRGPQVRLSSTPVSTEVLARYKAESQQLKQIREKSRANLSIDEILAALEKKPEEIPPTENLLSDLRAIEERSPQSTMTLFPKLLLFLKKVSREDRNETRLRSGEALISHLIFSDERISLGEDERRNLFQVFEDAIAREGKAAAAYLVLFSRLGQPEDLDCLKALKGKVRGVQLAHEFSKVIAALEKKSVARE